MSEIELQTKKVYAAGHRFNMDFLPSQWDELTEAARIGNCSLADLIRSLIANYVVQLKAYSNEHPGQEKISPANVLATNNDAGQARWEDERKNLLEQIAGLQLAQEIDRATPPPAQPQADPVQVRSLNQAIERLSWQRLAWQYVAAFALVVAGAGLVVSAWLAFAR